jgi:RNA polymerase sigma factor (sigma-70 family)
MSELSPQDWAKLEVGARPRLLAFARKLSKEENLAHDLVQETLIQAHRKLGGFDPRKGQFVRWASGILVNKWKDYNRSKMQGELPYGDARDLSLLTAEHTNPEEIALENMDPERRLFRTISNLHFSEMVDGLEYPELRVAKLLSRGMSDEEVMSELNIGATALRLAKLAIHKNIMGAAMEQHDSE